MYTYVYYGKSLEEIMGLQNRPIKSIYVLSLKNDITIMLGFIIN